MKSSSSERKHSRDTEGIQPPAAILLPHQGCAVFGRHAQAGAGVEPVLEILVQQRLQQVAEFHRFEHGAVAIGIVTVSAQAHRNAALQHRLHRRDAAAQLRGGHRIVRNAGAGSHHNVQIAALRPTLALDADLDDLAELLELFKLDRGFGDAHMADDAPAAIIRKACSSGS